MASLLACRRVAGIAATELVVPPVAATLEPALSRGAGRAAWRCSGGGMVGALGAVRGKKWKPFHSMYRVNFLREKARKEAEARREEAEAEDADTPASPSVLRADEPKVTTTPFQATRLMRAFDVFPAADATIQFKTKVNVDLTRESVRGTCHLPHGLQTKVRLLAFCPDDEIEEMLKAGADVAGISEPVRRINQGWLDFDRCVATPKVMPQVMKVAKVLGPRKMMPNPKSGTVVDNLIVAIKEAKGGTLVEYRAEGAGDVKVVIGDASFSDAKVLDNMKFFVQTLLRSRPRSTTKGPAAATNPLISGLGEQASAETTDAYFLDASIRLQPSGPAIGIDAASIMPSSVGYFR